MPENGIHTIDTGYVRPCFDAAYLVVENGRGAFVDCGTNHCVDRLLANMDPGRWQSVINVNIAAQLKINEALLASDHFKDSPRIISVSSTSGIAGNRGQTNYGASRGGVIGMVRATAPLMEPFGGTINAVAPGFIETEMTARMPMAVREAARRLNSLKQGGKPQDVAEAIAFLASDSAGGISGEVLRVCGQQLVGA